MPSFTLDREQVGLLLIDLQEKLLEKMERSCELFRAIQNIIKGFQILKRPIVITEQYPQGLGSTAFSIKQWLTEEQSYFAKTSFSCWNDPSIRQFMEEQNVTQWIVAGLETHVCILQTVQSLVKAGSQVVVLNDATASQSIYDFSTAIAEMRDSGARISNSGIVLFELLQDSRSPEFQEISRLMKGSSSKNHGCCSCQAGS